MSEIFSIAKGRTTTRVTHAPGGASSMSFGTDTPASPKIKESLPPQPIPPTVETKLEESAEAAVAEPESFNELKLKALERISSIRKESPAATEALRELLQKLDSARIHVPKALDAEEALHDLLVALKLRGSHAIVRLSHKLKVIDVDSGNKVSFDDFKKALAETSVQASDAAIHRLFRYFDADCNGYISSSEVVLGLHGTLSPRRAEMVKLAFKVLEKDGSGSISLAEVEGAYDASQHPDVLLGVKGPKEVLLEFIGTFEAQRGDEKGDGVVSYEEFEKYYGSVSASIDDDIFFELVIRNAWHISGGEGWSANATCKRVLVLHEDGSQTVEVVKEDVDVDTTDTEAIKKALAERGVKGIQGVVLYALNFPSDAAPSTPTPAPTAAAMSPGNTNKKNQMRSSIIFG